MDIRALRSVALTDVSVSTLHSDATGCATFGPWLPFRILATTCIYGTCHHFVFTFACFTSRGLNHVSLRNSLAVMVARTLLFRYTDSVVISDVTRLAATHRFAFLWFHAASGVSQSAASRRTMSGWRGTVIKIFGLNAFRFAVIFNKTWLLFCIRSVGASSASGLCFVFTLFTGTFTPCGPWFTDLCCCCWAWLNVAVFGLANSFLATVWT